MASTTGGHMSSLKTPIFTGKNYEYLYLTMKDLFRGQDVWEIIQSSYVEPTYIASYNNLMQDKKDALREHRNKYGKALFYIHQAMHERILPRVAATNKAKHAWDTLETAYQFLEKVKTYKLHILRRDFESLSMKDIKSLESFYTHAIWLINPLKSRG